ncbi:MAG: hypothetical protein FWE37_02610 [Spirochaetaceae bacterium]|nr:hypothetical protein [Spirochaetaceae bacterium]
MPAPKNIPLEKYAALFEQNLKDNQVANALNVNQSTACRMRKKWKDNLKYEQAIDMSKKDVATEVREDFSKVLQTAPAIAPLLSNDNGNNFSKEVIDNEYDLIVTLRGLRADLRQYQKEGNLRGVTATSRAIKDIGVPFAGISNLKGIIDVK